MTLLIQFYASSFETSQIFKSWFESDWILSSDFLQNELSHFSGQSELKLGILCTQLLLQFYAASFETLQVFSHGLKMCILLGYNPQILYHFFNS